MSVIPPDTLSCLLFVEVVLLANSDYCLFTPGMTGVRGMYARLWRKIPDADGMMSPFLEWSTWRGAWHLTQNAHHRKYLNERTHVYVRTAKIPSWCWAHVYLGEIVDNTAAAGTKKLLESSRFRRLKWQLALLTFAFNSLPGGQRTLTSGPRYPLGKGTLNVCDPKAELRQHERPAAQ